MIIKSVAASQIAATHPLVTCILIVAVCACVGYVLATLRGKALDFRIRMGKVSKLAYDNGYDDAAKIAANFSIGGWRRVARDAYSLFERLSTPEGFAKEIAGVFLVQLKNKLATDEGRKYVADQLAASTAAAQRALNGSAPASSGSAAS